MFFIVLFLIGHFFTVGCQGEAKGNSPMEVTSRLIELLEDPHPDVRRTAALSLGKIALPNAENALVKALKDPDPQVREYSAWALGQIGETADRFSAFALVGALGDKHTFVKRAAAQALGRIGATERVVELIREGFLVGERESRQFALESLAHLEAQTAYATLNLALNDQDPRVRQVAVSALGELGDARALPAFRKKLLQDPDIGVRSEVAYRLGKIGTRKEIASLRKAAKTDPDPMVHLWSAWALEEIQATMPGQK